MSGACVGGARASPPGLYGAVDHIIEPLLLIFKRLHMPRRHLKVRRDRAYLLDPRRAVDELSAAYGARRDAVECALELREGDADLGGGRGGGRVEGAEEGADEGAMGRGGGKGEGGRKR